MRLQVVTPEYTADEATLVKAHYRWWTVKAWADRYSAGVKLGPVSICVWWWQAAGVYVAMSVSLMGLYTVEGRVVAKETTMSVSSEMPRYQCHKKVHALKIERVVFHPDHVELVVEAPFEPINKSNDWALRHKMDAGGYLVVYEDGYESWSPAKAFEDGYTRLP